MAVRIGTLPDSSLVARRLAPNRRVLCASPVYLEKHGEPRDLNELQRHRLVAAGPQITWRFEGPDGPVNFKPHSVLETNSSEVVREAVVSGIGIGFRSTWDVSVELKRGVLRRVMPSYGSATDVNIYAVYSGRRLVPVKVRAFVDYLVSAFGPEEPYWDREIHHILTREVTDSHNRMARQHAPNGSVQHERRAP
jgi:DNA-binding transcriptional LysR family regulator